MKLFKPVGAAAFATVVLTSAAGAGSPFDGAWRIDSTKEAPRTEVVVIRNGIFNCESCDPRFTMAADGAFHPVKGRGDLDEVSISVVDAATIHRLNRLKGRVVRDETRTLSADGKTAIMRFTDTINAGVAAVTGTQVLTRVAASPPGAHALSGSWQAQVPATVSDNALTQTLKIDGDMLTMRTGEGFSYTARLDGTPARTAGDPSVDSVSVQRVGEREVTEVDIHAGKPVATFTYTVSADGSTLTVSWRNEKSGRTTSTTSHRL